jgi:microcompartment protein CcmK/EutM
VFTGKVEGSVVATVKDPSLVGVKLLLVRIMDGPEGAAKGLIVAGDATRQAGEGDFVTMLTSKEAALIFEGVTPSCDFAITGFIDKYNVEIEL